MSKAAAAIMVDSDEELSFKDNDDSDFSFDGMDKRKKSSIVVAKAGKVGKVLKKSAKITETSKAPTAVLKDKSVNGVSKTQQKSVEEVYQKKTQLEHILLRPDTYIGSVERVTQPMYVWNGEKIVEKDITFTPGLYKIYDELIVNAADNKQRHENTDKIEITINASENKIQVKNNGNGIPVVIHQEHNCYVPTLIFGHLLTGSNFDDDEKKTTGGRNGYGAKLANIFSLSFIVECVDTSRSLKFRQIFRNNMSIAEDPVVKPCTVAEMKSGDYVSITFCPDLARFKMLSLDDDIVALFSKRAFDIAGSLSGRPGKKLSVFLNGEKLPIKNFQSYLSLYQGIEPPAAFDSSERWEVGVSASDGVFQQVSFVNSICTTKGGQHVQYIADQVVKRIMATVAKKNKGGIQIKEGQMKNHLCIFVNCLIENPAFDSQTKENLTTRKTAFGSSFDLSDKFLKQVEKSGVVDKILAFAQFKQRQALSKQGGTKKKRLIGITKLDDANFAGSAKSQDCTLILTEGDSAKSLAMSGLSVVGRDYYGVFPLKGKPLNVRDATHTQIMQNEELKNVTEILGLKYGTVYDETNIKTLRYGHIMIMADQDHDGSHIKGLIINFFHHFWPSLLDIPGFLEQFITPIVKATKGKKVLTFFTIPEYETWKKSLNDDTRGWTIKYYKGLGTSTSSEAKDYFSNLDLHDIPFSRLSDDHAQTFPSTVQTVATDEDTKPSASDATQQLLSRSGAELIQMAFSKNQAHDRKLWISGVTNKATFFDYVAAKAKGGALYSDFINRELVLFSQYDNLRSIPNLYDGFKPSQRKVMFACFLRNLKSEMKVVQLGGFVAEKAAYHHGEQSLQGAIVNLAQDFVGSNNINLLTPAGQFGTRRMGGEDSASPRYIHTKLEKLARLIYHPDDDALLKYLDDDGVSIEPDFYMPVIPMCLVNGSEGIGTGWSTSIPNFNPRDIIRNLRLLIKSEPQERLVPFYFGFTGKIEEDPKKPGSYSVTGKIERLDDSTLLISELPIQKWTQECKEFLEGLMVVDNKKEEKEKAKKVSKGEPKDEETPAEAKESKKKEPDIIDFKENHTDTTVSFTITASKEKIDSFEADKIGLVGKFKLSTKISTTNMNLFNEEGRIEKFDSPEAVLEKFFQTRLVYYEKRKDHLLNIMRRELRIIANKARFVEEICNGKMVISNRKRADILSELKKRNYECFLKDVSKSKPLQAAESSDNETDDQESQDSDLSKGYDYLLGMKLWALTLEKVAELKKQLVVKNGELETLETTPSTALWERDLDAIEIALDERDHHYATVAEEQSKAQMKNSKRKTVAKGARKTKAKSNDDNDEDDSYGDVKAVKVVPFAAKKPAVSSSQPASLIKSSDSFPVAKSKVPITAVDKVSAKLNKVSSIEDESEMPLAERMKRKFAASPPKDAIKKPKSKLEDEDALTFDSDDFEPASLTPAPKKTKHVVSKSKATTKTVAGKNGRTTTIDSSFEDDDCVVVDKPVVHKNTARSVRDRKPVSYTLDLDSNDESDLDSD